MCLKPNSYEILDEESNKIINQSEQKNSLNINFFSPSNLLKLNQILKIVKNDKILFFY